MVTLASAVTVFLIVREMVRRIGSGRLAPHIAAGATIVLTGMLLSTADSALSETPQIAVAIAGTSFGVIAGLIMSGFSHLWSHVFSSA